MSYCEGVTNHAAQEGVHHEDYDIGLDLAKNVFQIHGANIDGKPILRKKLRRDQMMAFFANLEPCLIGMEACGNAHHWARQLQSLGYEVRLISPSLLNHTSRVISMT